MKPIRTACALFLVPLVMCLILPAPPVRSQGKKPPGTMPLPRASKTEIEVKEFSGDFARWVKALTITSADKVTFRYSTDQPGAVSALWQVSDKPYSAGLQITSAQTPNVIAGNELGPLPPKGHSSTFEIDFAQFAPQTPPGRPLAYWVFVVTKNAQRETVGIASPPVKIIYQSPGPGTKFSSPQIPPNQILVFARLPDSTLGLAANYIKSDLTARAVWKSLGGQLGEAPAACRWQGNIFMVVVNSQGQISSANIMWNGKMSGGWSSWNNKFSSRATCTEERYQVINQKTGKWVWTSRLHVFGRGWGVNQIWHSYHFDEHWAIQNGDVIGGENWGGQTNEAPAVASFYNSWNSLDKRLHQRRIVSTYVKGPDGRVWQRLWKVTMHERPTATPSCCHEEIAPGNWGSWGGIKITSAPSAYYLDANYPGGYVTRVFARGEDGAVWSSNGSKWVSLGGQTVGASAACVYGGAVHLFARSPQNELLYKRFQFGVSETTEWTNLGGTITSSPVCVAPKPPTPLKMTN